MKCWVVWLVKDPDANELLSVHKTEESAYKMIDSYKKVASFRSYEVTKEDLHE